LGFEIKEMKLALGQRWLWHFSCGFLHNDIIVEVVEISMMRVKMQYLQIIASNDKYDVLGKIVFARDFSKDIEDDCYRIGSTHVYTYLRGQDRSIC
jgi:hypothetical protein